MTDRVLELRAQIELAMGQFDEASARRDEAAATAHVDRARALDVLYAAAVPTTPQGAADKIRDAVVTLDMSEDAIAAYCVRDLNPIVKRLARGDRRLADVVTLRAVVALAKSRGADDDVLPALTTALEGIARPVMVAALQPSKALA